MKNLFSFFLQATINNIKLLFIGFLLFYIKYYDLILLILKLLIKLFIVITIAIAILFAYELITIL